MSEAERSAERWDALAVEQREWASYEAGRGQYAGVFLARARLYERAAESIRLTEATGVEHCACHLRPVVPCVGGVG